MDIIVIEHLYKKVKKLQQSEQHISEVRLDSPNQKIIWFSWVYILGLS